MYITDLANDVCSMQLTCQLIITDNITGYLRWAWASPIYDYMNIYRRNKTITTGVFLGTNTTLLQKLGSAGLANGSSNYQTNNAAWMALRHPSELEFQCVANSTFLLKIMTLSVLTVLFLSVCDMKSILLVQQCRSLESSFTETPISCTTSMWWTCISLSGVLLALPAPLPCFACSVFLYPLRQYVPGPQLYPHYRYLSIMGPFPFLSLNL